MPTINKKSFGDPDETTHPAEKVTVETVTVGGVPMQKVTAEPGWRWSKDNKPVLKTEACEKHHLLYMISGTVASQMNEGTELEFSAGDIGEIPPGHDGWTVGDEPAVWLEIPHEEVGI